MTAKNQHVVPHDGGWAVRGEGSRRATQVFTSKQEAIDRAIELARGLGSKMLVHGSVGQIFQRPDISPEREAMIRRAVREQDEEPLVDSHTAIKEAQPKGAASLDRKLKQDPSPRRGRSHRSEP
jgi:hypothetical protein